MPTKSYLAVGIPLKHALSKQNNNNNKWKVRDLVSKHCIWRQQQGSVSEMPAMKARPKWEREEKRHCQKQGHTAGLQEMRCGTPNLVFYVSGHSHNLFKLYWIYYVNENQARPDAGRSLKLSLFSEQEKPMGAPTALKVMAQDYINTIACQYSVLGHIILIYLGI